MSEGLTVPVALTVDDAPSIAAAGPVTFDPTRMDAVRAALEAAGVRHCVAFVIGEHARGHERALERWLASGYELGNHSDDHAPASRTERAAFVASIERCDALLCAVGAFDARRPRYFRFPYGDRGVSPSTRAALLAACEALGYTVAEVSIESYDHCYERPLAAALATEPQRAHAVEARYLACALAAVDRGLRLGRRAFGAEHVHVVNLHFGAVTQRTLPALLSALAPPVRFTSLDRALASPAYVRFGSDLAANGIIAARLSGKAGGTLRRIARLSRRAGWFEQSVLGPRWPHLSG